MVHLPSEIGCSMNVLRSIFFVKRSMKTRLLKAFSRHDHSRSAVKIAMNSGTRVFEIRELNVSEGEIRNLKQKSRRYSRGRITISSSLARSVATGKYTLEEAIAIHLSDEKSK